MTAQTPHPRRTAPAPVPAPRPAPPGKRWYPIDAVISSDSVTRTMAIETSAANPYGTRISGRRTA